MYIVLGILITCSIAFATQKGPSDLGRVFQVVRHDTNEVEMCVSNYGKFGQDETGNNSGCW